MTSIYIGKAPTEIILSELFCFTDNCFYAEPFSENLCVVIVDHVFDIRKICSALEELSKLRETAQGIGIPIGAGSGLYADIFEHRAQSFKALLKAFAVHILSLCPAGLGNSPEAREAHIREPVKVADILRPNRALDAEHVLLPLLGQALDLGFEAVGFNERGHAVGVVAVVIV